MVLFLSAFQVLAARRLYNPAGPGSTPRPNLEAFVAVTSIVGLRTQNLSVKTQLSSAQGAALEN